LSLLEKKLIAQHQQFFQMAFARDHSILACEIYKLAMHSMMKAKQQQN
jgi:hypothetical protein